MRRALRVLAVLPYLALTLPFAGTVPIWDAREYTDCIEAAVRMPISPAVFNCAGHPTIAWAAIMSALAWFAPARFWPLLLVSVAIGVVGLLAFHDLVLALFPDAEIEALLLTACLGVFPVVVAGTVDVNPDHGVLMFFLIVLRALVREKPRQAALAGLLLVFSKEPGVLLYCLAVGLWVLLFVTRRAGTPEEKARRLLRDWRLAAPLLAFGIYLVSASLHGFDPFWQDVSGRKPLLETFTTFRIDQAFLAQMLGIFVLQFAWVLTLLALFRWVRMAARAAFAIGPPETPALLFCDLLLLLATLLLTRYQTFLNLRYYLALVPLLLVCGLAGLRQVSGARLPRLAVLGALALLFAVSSLRTVDPLSKAAMGTIRFGDHEMLDMTRLTGECCGHGRDQIAYNLEHLHLHDLEDMFLADMHAHGTRALAAAGGADHHTVGRVSALTLRRMLTAEDSLLPQVWTADGLLEGPRPQRLAFLRYFFIDSGTDEARLRAWYRQLGERTYDVGGYTLTVADYALREPGTTRK
ncbi:MAG: glycosyltransferase family 39 protein [Deltaproteobacteria bacterium]|nr:MAG: glycosyltransferase family 39 protein [Deltaproteobacteria bacterium]